MAIELAGINLTRIHKVATMEVADYASHRIPGLNGNVVQNMGRESVRLQIEGIFYGNEATDNLESLRDVYKAREPVDFLAEIVGQAYFSQVIIERFEVEQAAILPDQYSFLLTIAEFVPPPEPESGLGFPDVDLDIGLEALDFMDLIQLPDLLSIPDFFDPTEQLGSVLEGVNTALGPLSGEDGPAQQLNSFFGEPESSTRSLSRGPDDQSDSIFVNIEVSLNADSLLGMIAGQLDFLGSADISLTDLANNPPEGILDLGNFFNNLSLPDIDVSNLLQEGFSAIGQLIPTDAGAFTGSLDGALGDFFGNLDVDLTAKISAVIDAFEAVKGLIELGHPLAEVEGEAEVEVRFRGLRGPDDTPDETLQALQAVRDYLDQLPDPLSVENLLEWILEGLQNMPREKIGLRYVPILDELRDKLETVLAWEDMTGADIGTHMAESVEKVEAAVLHNFITDGAEKIANQLSGTVDFIDSYTLGNTLNALKTGIEELSQMVQDGNLTGASERISNLEGLKTLLLSRTTSIDQQLFNGQVEDINRELTLVGDTLEDRMLQLIGDLNPPSDLPVLSLFIAPLNQAFDEIGLNDLNTRIQEILATFRSYIDQLNLSAISDTLTDVIDTASDAVNGLRDILIQATVEITAALDTVEEAIDDIGVEQLIDGMKNALEEFQEIIENGVEAIFGPVRDFLLSIFAELNNLLIQFNPAILVEELQRILQALTSVLSDPRLLDTIDLLRSVLDNVNQELGKFSFKPVTDVVVDAIGVVKEALKLATKLPLPDSLKEDLKKALEQIPRTIDPTVDAINEGLDEIIDEGPKPVLEAVRDQPAKLVELVESFSPADYIGENLTKPYQDFLDKMDDFELVKLLEPVNAEIDKVKAEIQETIDPVKLMEPLEAGFQELLGLLDLFDPQELIQPLQEKLTEGIHAITDNLPLDIANEAFDQIAEVTEVIQGVLDKATGFRDLLSDIQSRLAGLANAENQVRDFGITIANRLDGLDNLDPFFEAINSLGEQLDEIKAAPLLAILDQSMDTVIALLDTLQPQQKLVDLVGVHRAFPTATLEAMPDSTEKNLILGFLENFDPLEESYSVPLQKLEDWKTDLSSRKMLIHEAFSDWDSRFHGPNSPLNELRYQGTTLDEVKTLISETVNQQLTETLAPVFRIVDHLQTFFDNILTELVALINAVEAQVQEILQVGEALEELRQAINGLVDTLENFDITFLADEIEDIFNAIREKLEAISPNRIATIVKEAFDNLLAIFDLNTLLGVEALDAEYQQLVDFLKENDPTRLLAEVVQPEYDKIPEFLKRFDFSEPINLFIAILEALQLELETELGRTADAYEEMVQAVPSEFSGSLSANVNVQITAG